jgi:RNA polymerase sigma-70 factor (ECF subfamily)
MLPIATVDVSGQSAVPACTGDSRTRAVTLPSTQTLSDAALIRAIAYGDRHAMARLYARHSVRVHRFVLRIIGNATIAEDVVSEVFLDVWRHAKGFKEKSRVSTWLLGIARNKSLSIARQRSIEPLDEQLSAVIEDPGDDPETTVVKKDQGAVIRKSLLELPAAQREVIDLVYYHQKSVAEVAQIVGVPENTVKTRMFYARRRMGEILKAAGLH